MQKDIKLPMSRCLRNFGTNNFFFGTITFWAISRDILRGPRLFWPLKMSLEMAQKVVVPQKKNYVPQFLKQRDINSYYTNLLRFLERSIIFCFLSLSAKAGGWNLSPDIHESWLHRLVSVLLVLWLGYISELFQREKGGGGIFCLPHTGCWPPPPPSSKELREVKII